MSTSVTIADDRLRDYQYEWPAELSDLTLGEGSTADLLSNIMVKAFIQIAPVWDTWFASEQSADYLAIIASAERRSWDFYGFSLDEFVRRDALGEIEPSLAASELRVVVSSAYAPGVSTKR